MASMSMFVYEGMRDRIKRFAVLRFGFGSCSSQSSVAVGTASTTQPCKPKAPPPPTGAKMKSTFHFLTLRKPHISSTGMQRLIGSIRSTFSQLFVYKEEIEEMEIKEMEIGFPTDVKHVTHIGLDGSTTTNPIKGCWENNLNAPPDQILSFPSISLEQFELAMATQTHTQKPQLILDPHQHSLSS